MIQYKGLKFTKTLDRHLCANGAMAFNVYVCEDENNKYLLGKEQDVLHIVSKKENLIVHKDFLGAVDDARYSLVHRSSVTEAPKNRAEWANLVIQKWLEMGSPDTHSRFRK